MIKIIVEDINQNDVIINSYSGKQAMALVNNIISTWNNNDIYLYTLEKKKFRYTDDSWKVSKVYIAKYKRVPVAFALMETDGNISIGTRDDPELRGKGLVKRCLNELLGWFESKLNKTINVAIWGTADENIISRALAKKYGFNWSKREAPDWCDVEADWYEREKEGNTESY